MPPPPPELVFQKHVADFLVREHGFRVLGQAEIDDTGDGIVEAELWAFLQATQPESLTKLAEDYSTDARAEVMRALRRELEHTPLWLLMRRGLPVRGIEFRLYYAQPRSAQSAAVAGVRHNRFALRPHYYFGARNEEIDLALFLNGLPIVLLELKHEKNQNVHDAVAQYSRRDHRLGIFRHPFLYLAADTSEAMAATDPSRVENFRWYNSGLSNSAQSDAEYPVEFLYREVLAPDQLLEQLAVFLIHVPARAQTHDRPARAARTLFPRYHQSRMVRKVASDALRHFSENGNVGRKYLIQHSAGSGKTLSICWLADRLHSLYRAGSPEKLVDMVFIVTDRKALDTNIREDIEHFTHLRDVVGLARKADDLPRFLQARTPIVVTTQQKFAWVLDQIEGNPELAKLRVAFLIDEAHRSQEGANARAIRVPFRGADIPDAGDSENGDEPLDDEDATARIVRAHDRNQLFVAFTATPSPATLSLFGAPFDTYSEAEAIAEGYIVDVASSIIAYKTLYHLHCPPVPKAAEEALYPKGVVAKALQNAAYQDTELIQYKAEVMLRIFDASVRPLIGGRAKAMIVASSRLAGLRYFRILLEKLRERGAGYRVLYAFSDFLHPETNETITEQGVNELADGELIEDRFEGDEYRLMVVASKFQTGFDQPLLAGMFLDKPVVDRNAVQTVSRLNRCHEGKHSVVVVDFTNNASTILRAFTKYRQGTPYEPRDPDPERCTRLHAEILSTGLFSQQQAQEFTALLTSGSDAERQFKVHALRAQFAEHFATAAERTAYVNLLARFVQSWQFLSCFFTYDAAVETFVAFAQYVGPQLVKQADVSELMQQVRQIKVIKSAVTAMGEVKRGDGGAWRPRGGDVPGRSPPPQRRVSIAEMIDGIRERFVISDDEALCIREVTEEKVADDAARETIVAHRSEPVFLWDAFKQRLNGDIRVAYNTRARFEELADPKYTEAGGIFDIMAHTVIETHLSAPLQ